MTPRFEKVRSLLIEHNADVFFLPNSEYSGQPGTRYLCGFSGSTSLLAIGRDWELLGIDGRYVSQAAEEAPAIERQAVGRGSLRAICEELDRRGTKRMLFDGTRISHASILRMGEYLPGVLLENAPNLLQEIRRQKISEEIDAIRNAAAIASRAFSRLLQTIHAGETERAIAARLEFFMKEEGADAIAFDTIVASGKNGALPHARPGGKPLTSGEFVTIDFGAVVGGYACDITRTIAMGSISSELRDMYEAVRQAQEAGIRGVRPGISGHDLDMIPRSELARRGFGDFFLHATGHGLGMDVHELPIVGQGAEAVLAPGDVITIEPGVYREGKGGVRIEDDIAVTDTGHINLSEDISRELLTILPS